MKLNGAQLKAFVAKNKVPLVAAGVGGAAGLAVLANKRGGGGDGALPTYDSTATDIHGTLQPLVEELANSVGRLNEQPSPDLGLSMPALDQQSLLEWVGAPPNTEAPTSPWAPAPQSIPTPALAATSVPAQVSQYAPPPITRQAMDVRAQLEALSPAEAAAFRQWTAAVTAPPSPAQQVVDAQNANVVRATLEKLNPQQAEAFRAWTSAAAPAAPRPAPAQAVVDNQSANVVRAALAKLTPQQAAAFTAWTKG